MGYLFLAAALLGFSWLVLTWWNTPESKTFKSVVQDALRDIAEIISPAVHRTGCLASRIWVFIGPRLTNLPAIAVVLLDVYATATPEMREVVTSDWKGAAALLVLNLFARLSPRNAPQRIPPPNPGFPNGGLVNSQAIS